MNKKKVFGIVGGVALCAIIAVLIIMFTGGGDAYRSIKVFEIDGSCKVDRDGDSLDAFKNMALSSGDSLTVGEGSFARLKLDDDKYVYLEANTKINLTATGTANDSKTMVYIERGSMLTEVKKKLSATSSYDIVTPNTTMSIRGTKTLTQVLEDAVTGHVQTSNAVLEGQVKIKAVKVKADGTVVSVEKDLGAGEGNAFSSNKEELVSQEEMKSIADTGASVNGIKVEIVSEEDADVVFDVATFEASFLENVKNILVADAQAETGEEGLSQEQIDAINAQLGEVLESFDVISTESQKAIDAAASGEIEPEPTPEITPEPTPETTSESVWSWENIAATETDDTQDEGTTIVDGDTSLLVIDDADEADDTADRGNGADEVGTEDDDNDDAADEDGEEADETDEDEVSDEDDNAGEDDVDDADDAGDDDKSDEEGEEENTDEEDADKEDDEDEKAEDEESEEKSDEDSEDGETSEESGETPAEQTTQSTPSSGSGTGSSTTESSSIFNSKTWTAQFRSEGTQSGSTTVSMSAKLVFENAAHQVFESYQLPANSNPDALLPGYKNSGYEAYAIPVDNNAAVSQASALASYYSFVGWYDSESAATEGSSSGRIMTYADASGKAKLYPSVVKTSFVVLMNPYGQYAGNIVVPEQLPANIIDYELESDSVVFKVKTGTTFNLPVIESGTDIDHPYISKVSSAGVNTSLYCYSTNMFLDVPQLYLSGSTQTTVDGERVYYVSGSAPTVTVDEDYLLLSMYFVSEVELRVATNGGNFTVSEKYPVSSISNPKTIADMASVSAPQILPGAYEDSGYALAQKWTVSACSNTKYDYLFKTVYYGRAFDLPLLTRITDPNSTAEYSRELLCNYKLSSNGPVIRYASSDPVGFDGIDRWINTGAQYDTDGKCIFTEQLVDWVYFDMSLSDDSVSYINDRAGGVGQNIPYVIYDTDAESQGKYKFAVSPMDLYAEANATTQFGFTVTQTQITEYPKFVYAPDDLIYPWNSLGAKRDANMSSSPVDVYPGLNASLKSTYAFTGVDDRKLTGYKVEFGINDVYQNPLWRVFSLNESCSVDELGTYTLKASPCVNAEGESVANRIPLNMVVGAIKGANSSSNEPWDEGEHRMSVPMVFTPSFGYMFNVKARLEFSRTTNGAGGYTAATDLHSYYTLVLSGITEECFYGSGNMFNFGNLKLDYTDGNQFYVRAINNSVYKNTDDGKYYIAIGGIYSGQGMGTAVTYENGEVRIPLSHGQLRIYDGSSNQELRGRARFIRGLAPAETVTIDNYIPSDKRPVPESGESMKYSCFAVKNGEDLNISRVFTASESFTSNTIYGTGTVDGVIMDMCGSNDVDESTKWTGNDPYGFAYYGGQVSPFDKNGVVFVTDVTGNSLANMTKQVTRLTARSLIGANIADSLGISDSNGHFRYAGVFEFNKYGRVKIIWNDNELSAKYIFRGKQSDPQGNVYARIPAPWETDPTWITIQQAVNNQSEPFDTDNVMLYLGNYIYDAPDGFVHVYWGGAEAYIYEGTSEETESYIVSGGSNPTQVDAKDHKVQLQYMFPAV